MVNFLAVLVSAIAMMVVGMAWYSKGLFGKAWMQYSKVNQKDIEKAKKSGSVNKSYLVAFIAALVTTYVLSMLIELTASSSAGSGALLGFWIWLGFLATTTIGSVIWEGKPVNLYWINTGQQLVALVVAGLILGAWV